MITENKAYVKKFPDSVSFTEPDNSPSNFYKQEKFCMKPETESKLKLRAIRLLEMTNQTLEIEGEKNTKNICYLIITHATYVGDMVNILKSLKNDSSIPKNAF